MTDSIAVIGNGWGSKPALALFHAARFQWFHAPLFQEAEQRLQSLNPSGFSYCPSKRHATALDF